MGMLKTISSIIDRLSDFIAPRKGLLPLIGIGFVILNFILRLAPIGWITSTDLFLHLGIIIALLGILLAWAL
jgi:hypothetical protein